MGTQGPGQEPEGWGRAITFSFLCRASAWQVSPRAACSVWETTRRMQASGVCWICAASISSSSALHTEGDTSSGSTKRSTLRTEVEGRVLMRMTTGGRAPGGVPPESCVPLRLFNSSKNRSLKFKVYGGETIRSGGDCGNKSMLSPSASHRR